MKNKLYGIMIFFIIISCNQQENQQEINNSKIPSENFVSDFEDEQLVKELKQKIFKGDTIAYEKLKEIYYLSGNKNEFFFYSFYMAKNFKHKRAYNDCYFNLKYQYQENNDVFLNKATEYFLLKTYEDMPKKIESSVKEFYGDLENIPNSDSLCN